jgi:hypothetical protein
MITVNLVKKIFALIVRGNYQETFLPKGPPLKRL